MTGIANLGATPAVQDGDQFAVVSSGNGQTQKVAASVLAAYMLTKMSLPAGLLSAAGVYAMGSAGVAPVLGVAFANVAPQADPSITYLLPASAGSFVRNTITGEYIASRDVQAALVIVNAAFTLANPRILTLGVLTGPTASPYETDIHYQAVGAGAQLLYASIMGIVTNPTNANGKIAAGDKIRICAKADQAATAVTFQYLSTQVIPLDGV